VVQNTRYTVILFRLLDGETFTSREKLKINKSKKSENTKTKSTVICGFSSYRERKNKARQDLFVSDFMASYATKCNKIKILLDSDCEEILILTK